MIMGWWFWLAIHQCGEHNGQYQLFWTVSLVVLFMQRDKQHPLGKNQSRKIKVDRESMSHMVDGSKFKYFKAKKPTIMLLCKGRIYEFWHFQDLGISKTI